MVIISLYVFSWCLLPRHGVSICHRGHGARWDWRAIQNAIVHPPAIGVRSRGFGLARLLLALRGADAKRRNSAPDLRARSGETENRVEYRALLETSATATGDQRTDHVDVHEWLRAHGLDPA